MKIEVVNVPRDEIMVSIFQLGVPGEISSERLMRVESKHSEGCVLRKMAQLIWSMGGRVEVTTNVFGGFDLRADGTSDIHSIRVQRWSGFQSVAEWAPEVKTGCKYAGRNDSYDTHDNLDAAKSVLRLIERNGFGGQGKHFPLALRVEVSE